MAGPYELFRLKRLWSSFTFGSRQVPALLPSFRPPPLASCRTINTASYQGTSPNMLAFWSQLRPVISSVTVPSLLSVKRGLGGASPALKCPSCPVPPQPIFLPSLSQHRFCPVCGTCHRPAVAVPVPAPTPPPVPSPSTASRKVSSGSAARREGTAYWNFFKCTESHCERKRRTFSQSSKIQYSTT